MPSQYEILSNNSMAVRIRYRDRYNNFFETLDYVSKE